MWPFSDFQDDFRCSQSTADLLTVVSDKIARALNRSGATQAVACEQWPSGEDAGFPIQGSRVQNHWAAPSSTQLFILPRLIPGIYGNLVVKTASSKWL